MAEQQHTPLYPVHLRLNAKMVDFANYDMPVQYTGIIEEHMAVRNNAGIFDVSHMGNLHIQGKNAAAFLQNMCTNDMQSLEPNRCRYTFICNENGGVIDDVIVQRKADDHFLMIANAANKAKVLQHFKKHLIREVEVVDKTAESAQMALQGPKSTEILNAIGTTNLPKKYYEVRYDCMIQDMPVSVSRTGYTGEMGYEIICRATDAEKLFTLILDTGKPLGLLPCGLGARDTLRMEASMPLYGQELSETISPLEANLSMFVRKPIEGFIGSNVLQAQSENGVERKRIGLQMIDRGIPRTGYALYAAGEPIGTITSGGFCPALNGNYAMALVCAKTDAEQLEVEVRNKKLKAEKAAMPFYKRA